jgi:type IV pilus assembly protein PilC
MKEYISKINSEIKELTKKYNKVSIKSSKKSFSYFKNATYSRMSTKDQTFFVKRLSFLIKAGIPVLDSLAMIKDQTKKKSYSKILDKIIADVANGQNLSNSLAKFPGMFSEFSVNIIGFGESSGILSENLEYLADE